MKYKRNPDRARLLATARAVATRLMLRREGTRIRIRVPRAANSTNTDGWHAIIGNLGKGQPKLEIWLDRFSGYRARKFFACFRSEVRRPLVVITKRVNRRLWPTRTVTDEETNKEKYLVLNKRLGRSEFNTPFLEKYGGGRTFYGIYDLTRQSAAKVNPHFCSRAEAFFEDVARSLPHATVENEEREIYPQCENRMKVVSHVHRERSKLLATECKIRDNYECQVCGLRYEDAYGKLGQAFAEAHHLVPLSKLRESIKTRLEDLATVCANCHRMLHKMTGLRNDIHQLKKLRQKRRSRKKNV